MIKEIRINDWTFSRYIWIIYGNFRFIALIRCYYWILDTWRYVLCRWVEGYCNVIRWNFPLDVGIVRWKIFRFSTVLVTYVDICRYLASRFWNRIRFACDTYVRVNLLGYIAGGYLLIFLPILVACGMESIGCKMFWCDVLVCTSVCSEESVS